MRKRRGEPSDGTNTLRLLGNIGQGCGLQFRVKSGLLGNLPFLFPLPLSSLSTTIQLPRAGGNRKIQTRVAQGGSNGRDKCPEDVLDNLWVAFFGLPVTTQFAMILLIVCGASRTSPMASGSYTMAPRYLRRAEFSLRSWELLKVYTALIRRKSMRAFPYFERIKNRLLCLCRWSVRRAYNQASLCLFRYADTTT